MSEGPSRPRGESKTARHTTARLESSQNALDYYLRRGYLRCGPADADGALPLRKDLATAR